MSKYIISLAILVLLTLLVGCGKDDSNKSNFQVLADKEKELNDREAMLRLKEKELEEREKNLNKLEGRDTSGTKTDTSSTKKEDEKSHKKEIQKELTKKFENPATTVKDYYEYIQRAIYETGNFDANMQKAHDYFPSRSSEKMKASYRNAKMFSVVEEPKVVSQKGDKATVTSKIKQTDVVKKEGKDQEITKTLTVTYDLKANKDGQWEIVSNKVKVEN